MCKISIFLIVLAAILPSKSTAGEIYYASDHVSTTLLDTGAFINEKGGPGSIALGAFNPPANVLHVDTFAKQLAGGSGIPTYTYNDWFYRGYYSQNWKTVSDSYLRVEFYREVFTNPSIREINVNIAGIEKTGGVNFDGRPFEAEMRTLKTLSPEQFEKVKFWNNFRRVPLEEALPKVDNILLRKGGWPLPAGPEPITPKAPMQGPFSPPGLEREYKYRWLGDGRGMYNSMSLGWGILAGAAGAGMNAVIETPGGWDSLGPDQQLAAGISYYAEDSYNPKLWYGLYFAARGDTRYFENYLGQQTEANLKRAYSASALDIVQTYKQKGLNYRKFYKTLVPNEAIYFPTPEEYYKNYTSNSLSVFTQQNQEDFIKEHINPCDLAPPELQP